MGLLVSSNNWPEKFAELNGHDIKIKVRDKEGDVDSLFICEESNNHYLLERKRHAWMS
jgi:hypothetical protein